ncbi:tetratricopeptide repeat protein [Mangrovitalea sediminis]|uniref:tetratricopeptide repeat protein n=1 Tax=Mangrovitalea sediminis TaxID=1982043 RepID=UPI000BE5C2EA|nr:tetratricopeptide repeat protein [Mangrovitalea sediminis]
MRKPLLLSAGLLMLSGCASLLQHPAKQSETPKVQAKPEQQAKQEVHYGSFPPNVLFQLLTAEIAAQRGRYDVTLLDYVKAAEESGDLGIIKRAMGIAHALNATNAQARLSQIWLEKDPNSVQAHQIAALEAIRKKNFTLALQHMETILKLGGDANFDGLAGYAETLKPEEQQQILKLYQQLETRHPDNLEIKYSLGLLYRINKDNQQAMETTKALLKAHPDYQPAMLLYGTLLYDLGNPKEGLSYLRKQTNRYPDDRKLGTLYARMLLEDRQNQAAEDEFQRLMIRFPKESGLKLSHALVALDNGHEDIAKTELTELVTAGEHTNEAHYYLGRIADKNKDVKEAIDQYGQVEDGTQFFSALSRKSFLQAQEGNLQDALNNLDSLQQQMPNQAENLWMVRINLLLDLKKQQEALKACNDALEKYPNNNRIRYARAMLFDSLGRDKESEADFRKIIAAEPNNAVALNALGYTLTVKSTRYKEALELIQKAHKLDPKNPAITDSLGWVQYKLGNLPSAVKYLREAYAAFPDPEVATHLARALWDSGKKSEARSILQDSLKAHPGDSRLIKAMKELGIQ